MKIIKLFTSFKHGIGGHVYDLINITEALMKKNNEVIILALGSKRSPILKNTSLNVHEIIYENGNPIAYLKKIKEFIKNESPDLIHCYDTPSYNLIIIANVAKNYPILFSKCGGPNLKKLPRVPYLHLMSRENESYYKSHKKFQNTEILFFPNRVQKIKIDQSRINSLQKEISLNNITILRISRITEYYKESFYQTIELGKKLSSIGVQNQVLFIGTIESKTLKQDLESKGATVIYDNKYTIDASNLLDIADIVIGTGRGVMEAASLGKILLTPLLGKDLPVFITKDNINELFNTNFSPRNKLLEYSLEKNISLLENSIKNPGISKNYKTFITEYYANNFDINFNVKVLIDFYKKIEIKRHNKNITKSLLQIIKIWLRAGLINK